MRPSTITQGRSLLSLIKERLSSCERTTKRLQSCGEEGIRLTGLLVLEKRFGVFPSKDTASDADDETTLVESLDHEEVRDRCEISSSSFGGGPI